MNTSTAKTEYYEAVEQLQKDEWPEWVRCINEAIKTGDESLITNRAIWADWVIATYYELKKELQ